jgi:hypothetical protein
MSSQHHDCEFQVDHCVHVSNLVGRLHVDKWGRAKAGGERTVAVVHAGMEVSSPHSQVWAGCLLRSVLVSEQPADGAVDVEEGYVSFAAGSGGIHVQLLRHTSTQQAGFNSFNGPRRASLRWSLLSSLPQTSSPPPLLPPPAMQRFSWPCTTHRNICRLQSPRSSASTWAPPIRVWGSTKQVPAR